MITLKQIKAKKPCKDSWEKLLKSYGKTKADDTVVTCEHLLDILGINDTFWVIFNCIKGQKVKKRHILADIAERVLYIWEDWARVNAPEHLDASRKAIEATRSGKVTREIRIAAAAAYAADTADIAAYAAYATYVCDAADAARAAYAAYAAYVCDAAGAAAYAVYAVDNRKKEIEEQKKIILKYFGE